MEKFQTVILGKMHKYLCQNVVISVQRCGQRGGGNSKIPRGDTRKIKILPLITENPNDSIFCKNFNNMTIIIAHFIENVPSLKKCDINFLNIIKMTKKSKVFDKNY